MPTASVVLGGNAKTGSSISATRKAKVGITNSRIADTIKKICERKPWTYLVDMLNLSPSSARHKVFLAREFNADEIAGLLQTEDGLKILVALMADAKPLWWRICAPLMEIADMERMQLRAQRKLKKVMERAVDAQERAAATIETGRAALMVQDEEFNGEHVAAEREFYRASAPARRVPNSAMARSAKGPTR